MKPRALYLADIIEAIHEAHDAGEEDSLSASFALGVRVGSIATRCSILTGGDPADVVDEAIAMATYDELQAMN